MTSLALNSALLPVYLDSSLGRQVTNASHLHGEGRFPSSFWLSLQPHATPDHAYRRSIKKSTRHQYEYLRTTLWEQREEERKEGTAPSLRDRRARWRGWGQNTPCRCQSGRWGSARGRRRGRVSSHGNSTEQVSLRCRAHTRGSKSSRPAPPPRGAGRRLWGHAAAPVEGGATLSRSDLRGRKHQKEKLHQGCWKAERARDRSRGFAQKVSRGTW